MSINLTSLKLTDPLVLKAGGGLALYALGGSRTARLAGLALLGWAAWEYFQPTKPAPKVIPYDPDAPMPLQQAATSADPFAGTRWEGSGYTPSFRPARPGETAVGGKVLPFPAGATRTAPGEEFSGGINPEPGDNVG